MQPGVVIGAYRILQALGEGGMGQVWLVEHTKLGRRAAMKLLHPQYSAQPEIVTRFFNEARAATAITDPGIVQIFDFGHHTDGNAYIVMELLEGEPLDRRLRTQGPFPITHALRLIRQVASSLNAAHARGIVHRDLKPENIYVVRDAEVHGGERTKLLDFGIAKLANNTEGWKTTTSALMGTPVYMSPEQCRGAGQVDHRSDIYSLGCVMFVLVTGRPPFDADGAGEIIAMHLREPAPAPSRLVPTLPPELDQLVLRCLAKDPRERFQSGSELAQAIEYLLANPAIATGVRHPHPVGMAPAVATNQSFPVHHANPTTLTAASSQVVGATTQPPARRGRAGLFVGLAVVLIAGIGVVAATQGSGGANAGSASPTAASPGSPTAITPTATAPTATAPAATTPAANTPTATTPTATTAAANTTANAPAATATMTANAPTATTNAPAATAPTATTAATTAATPTTSATVKPAKPTRPGKPTKPTKPTKPATTSTTTTKPSEPTKPTKPAGQPPASSLDVDGDGIPDRR